MNGEVQPAEDMGGQLVLDHLLCPHDAPVVNVVMALELLVVRTLVTLCWLVDRGRQ